MVIHHAMGAKGARAVVITTVAVDKARVRGKVMAKVMVMVARDKARGHAVKAAARVAMAIRARARADMAAMAAMANSNDAIIRGLGTFHVLLLT